MSSSSRLSRFFDFFFLIVLTFALALGSVACGDDDPSDPSDAADGQSTDDTLIGDGETDQTAGDTQSDTVATCERALAESPNVEAAVTTRAATLGTWPNAIAVDGDYAYIVNSGDNAVQRYALNDPSASDLAFIDLGADKSPYDLAVYGDRIYITNNLEGSVTVADTTGQILGTAVVDELDGPQGIVATADYLLIANSEYSQSGTADPFGSLVVLTRDDAPSLVARIPSSQSNPQFVLVEGNDVYVVNSGATDYDFDTGIVTPAGPGGVDVFALDALSTASTPIANVEIAPSALIGNPGRPALAGATLYLGSGTASALFAVDTGATTLLRGADDPIWLGEASDANGFAAPFAGPMGALYVLDLNADALRVFDPGCGEVVGEPIGLAESTELMEGPLTMAWSSEGVGSILMTVSATITTFDALAAVR